MIKRMSEKCRYALSVSLMIALAMTGCSWDSASSNNETDNSEQIESTDKEVIVEDVVIEPENIYKKATTTVTQRKLPWALLISVGGGMSVLFGAGFATFLIIKKKKGL